MALEREQQRDVDRDPSGDRVLDRLQSLLRPGDLHEQIAPLHHLVQPAGLPRGCFGVVCEVRIDLERDPPVASRLPAVEHRREHITRGADVVTGQREEDLLGIALGREHVAQLLVVGVARADRALEDGRVRGHADDSVVDQRGEIAVLNE